MSRNVTAIDLFSGCGGLTTGLKLAGYKVLAAVEVDAKARENFELNHPEVPLIGADIRHLEVSDLFEQLNIARLDLDLLAGCPPCQGFSTLRNNNRTKPGRDARNNLIKDFERIALGLLPKMVMMENVAGIVHYSKFKTLVENLKTNGYSVRYEVLDVARYGVPQRRKRLILSASRIGDAVLCEPDLTQKITVKDAIGALPAVGQSGDKLHDLPSQNRTTRIQALIAAIPKNGGSRHSLPEHLQLECHKKTSGYNDVYGRMQWDDVSPTITGGCTNPSKGRFLHPQYDRAITLREAALLQGFPEDYKFKTEHGKQAVALMIGNALPPSFICAHSKIMAQEIINVGKESNR